MTNGTKILIGIVVIAAIITGGLVSANKSLEENENNVINQESVFDVIDNSSNQEQNKVKNNIVENNIQQDEVENDVIENTIEEENKNSVAEDESNKQEEVIGKEEQESSNENSEIDNESVAIDLAKQEWGIDVDSYNFEAKSKGNGVYEVSIINKTTRNVITIYNVNVRTGAVTE